MQQREISLVFVYLVYKTNRLRSRCNFPPQCVCVVLLLTKKVHRGTMLRSDHAQTPRGKSLNKHAVVSFVGILALFSEVCQIIWLAKKSRLI